MVELEIVRYDPRLRSCSRENRSNQTPAEKKLWVEVLSRRDIVKHKFTRQKPLGRFIADFYCSKLRLVIEIDGEYHGDRIECDDERTRMLESLGLRVIRYTNEQVIHDIEGVMRNLLEEINKCAHLKSPC